MESPYYEMTHDFEEENRLFQSGYVKGYHDAMMSRQEIDNLKHTAQSMMEGVCLLKEQEAVEPKQVVRKQCKKEHDDGSIDYFAEWYCPHCNSLILHGFDNPSIKFCYKCGKPVLWEGR